MAEEIKEQIDEVIDQIKETKGDIVYASDIDMARLEDKLSKLDAKLDALAAQLMEDKKPVW